MKFSSSGMLVIRDEKDIAEIMREVHYAVGTHENPEISHSDSRAYRTTKAALFAAMWTAYPELYKSWVFDIYDIWVDCNETMEFCVNVFKDRLGYKRDEAAEEAITALEDMSDDSDNSGEEG